MRRQDGALKPDEIIKILNAILIEVKENQRLMLQHDQAVTRINNTVRKIGINLSDLR
jgi:hypothetical protein